MMIWRHRYIVATALAGAAWGAGTVLFVWDAPDGARLFTGLVLSGMVAGAIPILAPVPTAFRTFTLPILVPLAFAILYQAESALDWAFGIMTIVFLVAVLASARYLHETLDVAIRLGLDQKRLVEDMKGARDDAEAALAARKLIEATLQSSEERYRLILQHSPTGILHYDNALIITYCNTRIAQILQVPMEKLIGLDSRACEIQTAAAIRIDVGAGKRTGSVLTVARAALGDASSAPNRPTAYMTTEDKAQKSPPRPSRAMARSSQRML